MQPEMCECENCVGEWTADAEQFSIRPGQFRLWQSQTGNRFLVRVIARIPRYPGLYKVRPRPPIGHGGPFTANELDLLEST